MLRCVSIDGLLVRSPDACWSLTVGDVLSITQISGLSPGCFFVTITVNVTSNSGVRDLGAVEGCNVLAAWSLWSGLALVRLHLAGRKFLDKVLSAGLLAETVCCVGTFPEPGLCGSNPGFEVLLLFDSKAKCDPLLEAFFLISQIYEKGRQNTITIGIR